MKLNTMTMCIYLFPWLNCHHMNSLQYERTYIIHTACTLPREITASILYLQWSPFNADTIWTTTACPEYRGVCISNTLCIFLVGVAMHTHALKRYKGTFQSSSLLYAGEKANHRLVCTMCTNLICYNNIQL